MSVMLTRKYHIPLIDIRHIYVIMLVFRERGECLSALHS